MELREIDQQEAQDRFEQGQIVSRETADGWQNYEAIRGLGEDDGNITWQSAMHPSFEGCNARTETRRLTNGYQLPDSIYRV